MRIYRTAQNPDEYAPYWLLFWKDPDQEHEIEFGRCVMREDADRIVEALNAAEEEHSWTASNVPTQAVKIERLNEERASR